MHNSSSTECSLLQKWWIFLHVITSNHNLYPNLIWIIILTMFSNQNDVVYVHMYRRYKLKRIKAIAHCILYYPNWMIPTYIIDSIFLFKMCTFHEIQTFLVYNNMDVFFFTEFLPQDEPSPQNDEKYNKKCPSCPGVLFFFFGLINVVFI